MRGIVLLESLEGGQLPMPFQATVIRRYPHMLGGQLPVTVAEITVTASRVETVAMQLAQALLPRRFYAHLLDDKLMYVAFPRCVVQVVRGDEASVAAAQEIGLTYGIPREQMRFTEMFDNDHPDSPATATAGTGAAWQR